MAVLVRRKSEQDIFEKEKRISSLVEVDNFLYGHIFDVVYQTIQKYLPGIRKGIIERHITGKNGMVGEKGKVTVKYEKHKIIWLELDIVAVNIVERMAQVVILFPFSGDGLEIKKVIVGIKRELKIPDYFRPGGSGFLVSVPLPNLEKCKIKESIIHTQGNGGIKYYSTY
ncbi:MAG: hypothetical protein NTV62_01225 [Candidatus Gribaldobacteria bacterium]|nr:hypothetical protein [Candidatus Gribaldobacteria bacterium]